MLWSENVKSVVLTVMLFGELPAEPPPPPPDTARSPEPRIDSPLIVLMTSTGPSFGAKARENASMRPRGFFRSMTLKKSKQKRKRKASGNPSSARVNGGGAGGTTGCEKTNTGLVTLLAITAPSFYSFEKAPLKAAGSTVVGLLALAQLWSMETAMGHLPRAGLKMKVLMRTHRYTGRIALVLAAVVAYFCLRDVGVETNVLRGAIHGFFGSTAFVAIAIKLALLRFRPRLAYDAAPWLGRYAAFAFIVVWITSAYAFYTNSL